MRKLLSCKNNFVSVIILFVLAVFLTACGGSAETNNNPPPKNETPVTIDRELSGTAANGAPVVGTITIVDADGGTLTTRSDNDGNYSVNLEGRRGPYLIRIVPDDNSLPVMYSYATGSGVANITPFTMLALYLAYHTDLSQAFNNWLTTASTWTRANLELALAKINANFNADLQTAGVDPTLYDFFTAVFVANHTGIDAFLDAYNVSINFTNNSYEITDNFNQPVAFNENIDTTGYYIGAHFVPVDGAQWNLTYTYAITLNYNGTENTTSTTYTIPSSTVPWSEDRFNELFWDYLGNYETQTYTCPEDPRIDCEYTWRVTQLDSSYVVTGNGEVGTVVTGSAVYSWSFTGFTQYIGQPRQDFSYIYTWGFSWSWERVS